MVKKKIENNEKETSMIQRRSYYAKRNIEVGERIKRDMIIPLRPYLKNSISPDQNFLILNKKSKKFIQKGKCIKKDIIL